MYEKAKFARASGPDQGRAMSADPESPEAAVGSWRTLGRVRGHPLSAHRW